MTTPTQDNRLKRFGWAPGKYLKTCTQCSRRFIGDKRATWCADCAYAKEDPKPAMITHTEAALRGDLELLNRTVAELVGATGTETVYKFRYEHPSGGAWVNSGGWRDLGEITSVRNDLIKQGRGVTNIQEIEVALELPNFTGSLDACRTFEEGLTKVEARQYECILIRISWEPNVYTWQLKPPDHCIALCYLRNVITPTTPQ